MDYVANNKTFFVKFALCKAIKNADVDKNECLCNIWI